MSSGGPAAAVAATCRGSCKRKPERRKYYCGPGWAPQWVLRIFSGRFNGCCRVHDLDYASGRFTRKQSDDRFLENMLQRAGIVRWRRVLAYMYYALVRLFGRHFWVKSKERRQKRKNAMR